MKGLLIKEFYNLKNYLIIYYLIDLFMFILYCIFSFVGINNIDPKHPLNADNAMGLLFLNSVASVTYLLFFAMYLIHLSFELDEKSNFTKFIISIGIDRNRVVTSKLIVGFIGYLLPLLLLIIISFSPMFITQLAPFYGIEKIISNVILFCASIVLNIAITLSLVCFLEITKARIVSTFISILVISVEVGLYGLIIFYDSSYMNLPFYSTYIISASFLIISFIISTCLYYYSIGKFKQREF